MNQQPNFNTASPNYTIADTNSSSRVSPGLYVLMIGNYLLLTLNILIIILPLAYYLLVYKNHVPDYSPYGALHTVMTPFEFFVEVYWIRLVVGLIVFVMTFGFIEYFKLIKTGIQFHKWRSKNNQ